MFGSERFLSLAPLCGLEGVSRSAERIPSCKGAGGSGLVWFGLVCEVGRLGAGLNSVGNFPLSNGQVVLAVISIKADQTDWWPYLSYGPGAKMK